MNQQQTTENNYYTNFTVNTDTGEYDLSANIQCIGKDMLIAVWGGEKPHIGAVSAAQSGPSLKDPDISSSSASVICYPGHKEDEIVKSISEILSAKFDNNVVVTAGIHWDKIAPIGISKVIQNTEILTNLIVIKIEKTGK